jgi:hypothetical protein
VRKTERLRLLTHGSLRLEHGLLAAKSGEHPCPESLLLRSHQGGRRQASRRLLPLQRHQRQVSLETALPRCRGIE